MNLASLGHRIEAVQQAPVPGGDFLHRLVMLGHALAGAPQRPLTGERGLSREPGVALDDRIEAALVALRKRVPERDGAQEGLALRPREWHRFAGEFLRVLDLDERRRPREQFQDPQAFPRGQFEAVQRLDLREKLAVGGRRARERDGLQPGRARFRVAELGLGVRAEARQFEGWHGDSSRAIRA